MKPIDPNTPLEEKLNLAKTGLTRIIYADAAVTGVMGGLMLAFGDKFIHEKMARYLGLAMIAAAILTCLMGVWFSKRK
jgi:hypothetical protein